MTPEQWLALLPNTLLAAALFYLIKREVSRLEREKDDNTKALKEVVGAIASLITRETLERVCTRYDDRIGDLRERVRVLESKQ